MDIRTFRRFIRKLEREIDSQFKGNVDCCGVSSVQCHTLLELEELGSTNVRDLAKALCLDKSTVSRTIDGLVNQGLVKRKTDTQNRRYLKISLTESGSQVCMRINKICDSYYHGIVEEIPDSKRTQVSESLEILTDILIQKKQAGLTDCGCGMAISQCSTEKESCNG